MNKNSITTFLFGMLFPIACIAADLPDSRITPGAVDPGVSQENIDSTICVRGYTKQVRPPRYFTDSLKRRQLSQYGYADRDPRDYEEDHLIPLNIGGSPRDERNLWPEPRNSEWGADRKDELEYVLYRRVCSHSLGLVEAQQQIAHDWISAYRQYVGTDGPRRPHSEE